VTVSPAELRERAGRLARRLAACDLCPRRCGVDRTRDELGCCGVGREARLVSALPHFGEEPPLSGTRGAGTVFLGGCNLGCVFCQNRQISRPSGVQRAVGAEALAGEMLRLAGLGCHNLELVTPTHVVPQILAALARVAEAGCALPVVWNSGGYDALDVLRELEGVVDVYLPDLKFADAEIAGELAGAPDYWDVARAAASEMTRQCGALECDADGIARRGVIVRHLVLPNGLAGSQEVLRFVAGLRPRPRVSLMAQFYPIPECEHPLLQRPLFAGEYERARRLCEALGLDDGWIQDEGAPEHYRPDFARRDPFAPPPTG
jgi:putative pyruvate formate lyase activating enzyme